MNQKKILLDHFIAGYSITQPEARRRFEVERLSARIEELRRDGHEIIGTAVEIGGRKFKRYTLIALAQAKLAALVNRAAAQPFSVRGEYARAAADLVAMAASDGLITTRLATGLFGRHWAATEKGLAYAQRSV